MKTYKSKSTKKDKYGDRKFIYPNLIFSTFPFRSSIKPLFKKVVRILITIPTVSILFKFFTKPIFKKVIRIFSKFEKVIIGLAGIKLNFDFRIVDFQTTSKLMQFLNRNNNTEKPQAKVNHHFQSSCLKNWLFEATIYGSMDCFKVAKDIVLFSRHPLKKIQIPDVENHRLIVSKDSSRAKLVVPFKMSIKKIDNAISLVGTGSANYCHWLVDHLPKLLIAEKLLTTSKIIVDDNMPATHYEALKFAKHPNQTVFILRSGEPLKCHNVAILPNCSATITFPSDEHEIGDGDTYFDGELLKCLVARLEQNLPKVSSSTPKRVFFDRGIGRARRIVNHQDVCSLLARYGFVRVYPDTLSFIEQISIVKSADLILSQNGGATANLIFCKPDAQFIGITNNLESNNTDYFPALANTMQINFTQLFSRAVYTPLTHPAHFDLEVDLVTLEETLLKKMKPLNVE